MGSISFHLQSHSSLVPLTLLPLRLSFKKFDFHNCCRCCSLNLNMSGVCPYINYLFPLIYPCQKRKLDLLLLQRKLRMWIISLSLHHLPHSLDFLDLLAKTTVPPTCAIIASREDTKRTVIFIWKVHMVTSSIAHRWVLHMQPFLQLLTLLPLLTSLHRSSPLLQSNSSRYAILWL